MATRGRMDERIGIQLYNIWSIRKQLSVLISSEWLVLPSHNSLFERAFGLYQIFPFLIRHSMERSSLSYKFCLIRIEGIRMNKRGWSKRLAFPFFGILWKQLWVDAIFFDMS